jgi:hypothetical protein
MIASWFACAVVVSALGEVGASESVSKESEPPSWSLGTGLFVPTSLYVSIPNGLGQVSQVVSVPIGGLVSVERRLFGQTWLLVTANGSISWIHPDSPGLLPPARTIAVSGDFGLRYALNPGDAFVVSMFLLGGVGYMRTSVDYGLDSHAETKLVQAFVGAALDRELIGGLLLRLSARLLSVQKSWSTVVSSGTELRQADERVSFSVTPGLELRYLF